MNLLNFFKKFKSDYINISPQERNKRFVENVSIKEKIEYIKKVHWKMNDFEMFSHLIKKFNIKECKSCLVFYCQHGVKIAQYIYKDSYLQIIFVNGEQFYNYWCSEYGTSGTYRCDKSQINQFNEIMNNCYYDAQMWDGEIEQYKSNLKQEALNKSLR